LRRAIQRIVEDALSEKCLLGEILPNCVYFVDWEGSDADGELVLHVEHEPPVLGILTEEPLTSDDSLEPVATTTARAGKKDAVNSDES
jgi:hypothetical protein